MIFHPARQPVILLGMHRSGTAMIARLLDDLGLFQGAVLQDDHESAWFLELNDLLLRRVNGAWDNPAPIRALIANGDALGLTVRCLAEDLASARSRVFLGIKRALKYRSLCALDETWGWKDPRTIFTLPIWLKLFPAAKLVYIVRNGVDVAASLRVREVRELQRRLREFASKAARGRRFKLRRAGFRGSSRCLTLEGAFSLWEEYVQEAQDQLAQLPNPRLVLRYEQFLGEPGSSLTKLAEFCGLDTSGSGIQRAIETVGINDSRANACRSDPELAAFERSVRDSRWMVLHGYNR